MPSDIYAYLEKIDKEDEDTEEQVNECGDISLLLFGGLWGITLLVLALSVHVQGIIVVLLSVCLSVCLSLWFTHWFRYELTFIVLLF